MMQRADDKGRQNFAICRRRQSITIVKNTMLQPGSLFISADTTSVLNAVLSSTVLVTIFDPRKIIPNGGACHFIHPKSGGNEPNTAVYGLPAILTLLKVFLANGANASSLQVGLFGGACPAWATTYQKERAAQNVELVRKVMSKKGINIKDEDVGGTRGRKVAYRTDNNDIAIIKTDFIRQKDWFPLIGR